MSIGNAVTPYLCGEAIGFIKRAISAGQVQKELRNHIEILIERNTFIESDLTRFASELSAEKSLSLEREKARADAREAQLKTEQEIVELQQQLAKYKQWEETRKKYNPDEKTGLQIRKRTGGTYCPKCLYAEPPVEQPVPFAPDFERYTKCPICGSEFPNKKYRQPSSSATFAKDDFHN